MGAISFCFFPLAFNAEISDLCTKFKCLYSFIVLCGYLTTKGGIYFDKRKDFLRFFLFFLLFSKLPLQRQFTEQQNFTLKISWKNCTYYWTYNEKLWFLSPHKKFLFFLKCVYYNNSHLWFFDVFQYPNGYQVLPKYFANNFFM